MGLNPVLPVYVPLGNEADAFWAAHHDGVPVMLTGPTGCGKTRFVEHMSALLGRPLITVTCHHGLTATDLLGHNEARNGRSVWVDGPLTRAVRQGSICYLDEVTEASLDLLPALYALCDHRRTLFLASSGEVLKARAGFTLVCSYNIGRQGPTKELWPAFRQRFVTLDLGYLGPDAETVVVASEAGISIEMAARLVAHGAALRNTALRKGAEPPSTRLLIIAASLIERGLSPSQAIVTCLLDPTASSPVLRTCSELRSGDATGMATASTASVPDSVSPPMVEMRIPWASE